MRIPHGRPRTWFLAAACLASCPAAATSPAADSPFSQEVHEPRPLGTDAANDVRALAIDAQGQVWAATRDGVFVTGPGRTAWQPVAPAEALRPAFAVAAAGDTVWAGTGSGLYRLTHAEARPVSGVAGPVAAVAAAGGLALAGGPGGFFRVGEAGTERFDPGCTHYLSRVAIGANGTFWFATAMGLYRWTNGTGRYLPIPFDEVSASVRGLAFGAHGEIWAATLGGLQVFKGDRLARQFRPADGLPSADVRCVARSADGRIWVGTGQGVAWQAGRRWAVRASPRWLLSDDVRDIAFGSDGAAWVATAGGVSVLRQVRLTLVAKAARFQSILEARHVRPPGIVEKCRLRTPGDLSTWTPTDDDNDGGYTAVYLAMESYRYAATHDPAALANARRAFAALEFLQRVTGTPGFVARTVVPADWKAVHDPNEVLTEAEWATRQVADPRDKRVPGRWRPSADGAWLWKGDTSSDEITAHFFGYFAFHELAATPADRERIREQVRRITDHLIEHGFTLTDLDGQPTRWGVWAPGRLNGDPDWAMERGINSVELLSFLKLAHHVTGDAKYEAHYRRLIAEHHYDRNALAAPNLNPAWRTHIDAELLAFAYPPLLALERDPRLRRTYRTSFERWHDAFRADGNPFFEMLYATYARPHRTDLNAALAALRDTPLDLVRWTVDNSTREDVRLRRFPEVEAWQTERLLPPSETGFTRTDQNPWLARQGDGGQTESDGVFWLLPYWMARHGGFLGGP